MILNTDYTRQLYVGLSSDDWSDFSPNEGDVVYLMDQSKCYIFDGSTMQELPDLGGGGGGGSGDIPLTMLYSGDYVLASTATSINIPVPGDGLDSTRYRSFFIVRDSNYSGTAIQSSACTYLYYPEDQIALTNTRKWARTQTRSSDDTRHYYYGDSTGAENIWFNYTPELQLHVSQYSSNYNLRAGTYHWYVWGYPAL